MEESEGPASVLELETQWANWVKKSEYPTKPSLTNQNLGSRKHPNPEETHVTQHAQGKTKLAAHVVNNILTRWDQYPAARLCQVF